MNVVVWWFVLMFGAWILTALILWGTNIVVSDEENQE